MAFTERARSGRDALARCRVPEGETRRNVLIIAVELPSLTFQPKDIRGNPISRFCLDGAAQWCQRKRGAPGRRSSSETYTSRPLGARDSISRLRVFHIMLSKDVPEISAPKDRRNWSPVPGAKRPETGRIKGWIMHPGGARLAWQRGTELGLTKCDTQASLGYSRNWGSLERYNLFILQECWKKGRSMPRIRGGGGVGPGFSAEFLLLCNGLSVIAFSRCSSPVVCWRFVGCASPDATSRR